MTETVKQYNGFIKEIQMILHPNLVDVFLKIHNKLIEEAVEEAKNYKPTEFMKELEADIKTYAKSEDKLLADLRLKMIIKKIKNYKSVTDFKNSQANKESK